MMEEKTCLDCGQPIKVGRKDKKFCSDTCRTNFNNNRDRTVIPEETSVPKYIKRIQDILVENRKILDECLGDHETKIMSSLDLGARGFIFKYFTSRSPTLTGEMYCLCFELGYKEIENDRVLIVRREREIMP